MKPVFEKILNYTVKAPSCHNTQPWKFRVADRSITIYPDYSRELPVADPDHHSLFISLGCALENMVIAANHLGYAARVEMHFSSADDHITINLSRTAPNRHDELFDSINVRQSTRNRYNGKPIPERDLEYLRAASVQEDVEFFLITDREEIKKLVALAREALNLHLKRQAYIKELARWVRFNRGASVESGDGLYVRSTGARPVPGWMGKMFMAFALSGQSEVRKFENHLLSGSALLIFAGKRNDKKAWVNVGRSFERVALTATSLGINHAHANMPCEEPTVREKMRRQLNLPPGHLPFLFGRIGYSTLMAYSFRRPLEEVILKD